MRLNTGYRTLLQNRFFLPLCILAAIVLFLAVLYWARPQADRNFTPPVNPILVDAEILSPTVFHPVVRSYGLVEARVNSKVVTQVGGRVDYVSEAFRDGGFFRKGDVLLRIDAADYEIEMQVAEANLAEAQRQLEEAVAEAEQAREDWKRLGNDDEPSPLVLREPQLKSAQAAVKSAQAQLKLAQLNLERTEIKAPFDGRVLSTEVDLGQVVSSNTTLGDIYATDAVEVRLPIKNSDVALLELPESYRHREADQEEALPVRILSELAGNEEWLGRIVRTSGSIDSTSRQLYVVARIDSPFGEKAEGRFPLKIGQYVTARIQGRAFDDAIVIPNSAIYQGSYVFVLQEGAVYRREIKIAWLDEEQAVIKEGLSAGDQLVISPLGQVSSGTPAQLRGEKSNDAPDLADRRGGKAGNGPNARGGDAP